MTEIELKAHVFDKESLFKRLSEIAVYKGSFERYDEYWGKSDSSHKIRIRRETCKSGICATEEENNSQNRIFLTYKQKERREDGEGAKAEVNDEKECIISDARALEAFLLDNGFSVLLQKKKAVEVWTLLLQKEDIPPQLKDYALSATFELCTVPPLGDFLEIEILSPAKDEKVTAEIRKTLKNLLYKAGLCEEAIEMRYYSEMLREFTIQ